MSIKASRQHTQPFRVTGQSVAAIAAAPATTPAGKPKLKTFTGRAYTGAAMRPEGWGVDVVIDLDGIKIPSQHRPALRQHDHQQIVGHTESVKVVPGADGGIDVAGLFSGEDKHVVTVTDPASKGFQWQLSVGANPTRTEFLEAGEETEVNGRKFTGPIVISRETELGEISFVPLGADGATSATVSASNRKVQSPMYRTTLQNLKAAGDSAAMKYSDDEIAKMTEDEAKAALKKCMAAADDDDDDDPDDSDIDADDDADLDAADDDDMDADDDPPAKAKASRRGKIKASKGKSGKGSSVQRALKARRKAEAKETLRCEGIRAAVKKHGVTHIEVDGRKVNLEAHAIERGWAVEKTELHALRAARPAANVGNGPHLHFASQPEMNEAVLEAAVLHAHRHSFKLEDDDFYVEDTPDGKSKMRRVPLALQKQAQGELRARYSDQVQQSAHSLFKGRITLKQLLTLAAQGAGLQTRQLDLTGEQGVRDYLRAWDHSTTIRAEGASTTSISNILANVMNKFALQGYLFTEQAWREICAIRPVNDFKPSKSINLLGDVMFKQVGPTGELANASFGDQAFSNQANPFGRIATLPWTHIVNDDLSILQTAPQKVGQGAGLAINDNIWTLWKNMAAGTVNGDDGNAFWRITSSVTAAAKTTGTAYLPNKQSGGGSAFGDAGLKAAKALFDNQIDPNGNPLGFDGLTPVLLHGPTLWRDVTAQMQAPAIVYGSTTNALTPSANVWQGKMKPVMSRYIENASYVNSTTAWWLLFNPIALAVIEVCFLNGVDTPAVLQAGPDYQFDRLGISIRGTMPFGSNQQNFRGGVYSVGA